MPGKKKQYGTLVLERRDLEDKILGASKEYAKNVLRPTERDLIAANVLRNLLKLGILVTEMEKRVADGEG